MTTRLRSAAKKIAPTAFAAVIFITGTPETRQTMLATYAIAFAVFTAWYAIAKIRHRRWLAAAPQREAEQRARTRAFVEEWYRPKPEQQTAEYFNWDGPYTVAGQPR